jgi:coatomer subunit beta'
MFHVDRPLYLLGYIPSQQRVYLIDREYSVVSYSLLLALVEFKTLVMRGEMDKAFATLETLPEDQLDGCDSFLSEFSLVVLSSGWYFPLCDLLRKQMPLLVPVEEK